MLDLIASLMVRGLNRIFHYLPVRFNLMLGRSMGWVVYKLSGKRARITYANLKAAFHNEKPPREIKRITREAYRNMAQTFAELMSMTKFDREYLLKYVKVRNLEWSRRAFNWEKGSLFVSAHFGNWELCVAASVAYGNKVYFLVREQKMRRLNELLNQLREMRGNEVVRKGMDIRTIFRLLREGKSIGIAGDQNGGHSGVLVDFFGRPASTAVGPYKFAQKSGAMFLPIFIHRVEGPYHEIVVEEPMIIAKGDDLVPYMKKYNSLLEKHIRDHPEQWLWMHKRWKLTTLKKILVLSDGKKGHLKQSLAVVKQIRAYREQEGVAGDQTVVQVLEVRFRSSFRKGILNILSPFTAPGCQGSLKLLKWALEEECFSEAAKCYADVIVSCGTGLFGVNHMLKVENNARNVTVFDPGKRRRKFYDLVILCRNDAKGRRTAKMVVTDLAPNLVDPEEIKVFSPANGNEGIGLLFGGDNPCFLLDENTAGTVAEEIAGAAEDAGAEIRATTSRRTAPSSEKRLEEIFSRSGRCSSFVRGAEDEDERTVEKILASSRVVVVSGESISMVSEAVSSGRKVVVFLPKKRTAKTTKFERFLEGLRLRGYIDVVEPESLGTAIGKAFNAENKAEIPEDDRKIREKIYKLF
ncbi:MAG: hypothetical protein GF408_05565 [Candidatus Omnitrophica bacterium]|nr:hypothetical protein [Candidatus Omnitrophota bacterium]